MESKDPIISLASFNPLVLLIAILPPSWRGLFAAILLSLFGLSYLSRVIGAFPRRFDTAAGKGHTPSSPAKPSRQRKKRKAHLRH